MQKLKSNAGKLLGANHKVRLQNVPTVLFGGGGGGGGFSQSTRSNFASPPHPSFPPARPPPPHPTPKAINNEHSTHMPSDRDKATARTNHTLDYNWQHIQDTIPWPYKQLHKWQIQEHHNPEQLHLGQH